MSLINKRKKKLFKFTSIFSYFLDDSQKITKLLLNGIINVVGRHFVFNDVT